MPLNKLETLLQSPTQAEFNETIMRRSLLASYILEGNHPEYPVHVLIDNVPLGVNDTICQVSYYLTKENNVLPILLNSHLTSPNLQDILFKIANIPEFVLQYSDTSYDAKRDRIEALHKLQTMNEPLAVLGINTMADNLFFSLFSHHAGFSASEALMLVQENAIQQLAKQTGTILTVHELNNVVF